MQGQTFQLTHRLCLALAVACLTGSGCESSAIVGSSCKDGVCPLVSGADNCLVRSTQRAVAIVGNPSADPNSVLRGICMPNKLVRDAQGFVDVRVHWVLPLADDDESRTVIHCSDLPFLRDSDAAFDAEYRSLYPGREVCDVDQVPIPTGTDTDSMLTGAGFYYDDFSETLLAMCAHGTPARIAFNRAYPLDGAIVKVVADEVLDAHGEPDTGRVCRAVADAGHLGKRCLPPLERYDASQSILETRSAACGGSPCLAYHLDGSTAADCVKQPVAICDPLNKNCQTPAPCVDSVELAKNAFCSCRCDAPEPDAELCQCGQGFKCTPLIEDGDPALVGSYCVRQELLVSP